MTSALIHIGRFTLLFIGRVGKSGVFLLDTFKQLVKPPFLFGRVMKQVYFIGVKTTSVVLLTGFFTGMVLTLQSYYVLVQFGAESRLGAITALALIRELGPVVTALMVIGRAGSALTAELGIMRITEQIDALDSMNLNPYKYLIVPNLIAAIISVPVLTCIFNLMGIWGGHFVGITLSNVSMGAFYGAISDAVVAKDISLCLQKAAWFGFLIAWICCFKGYYTGTDSNFGAQGVSRSTTQAVVLASVMILVIDYFITSLILTN